MVAIASRAALTGDETHDAWVHVFATIMQPPIDTKRAACPNCGFFAVDFRFIADERSRVGICALWCEHCGHGHTLGRVRVPDGIDVIPLDAPDDVLRTAVPEFYDAAAHQASPGVARNAARATGVAVEGQCGEQHEMLVAAFEQALELLTAREREVLTMFVEGRRIADIARELSISQVTVRSHIQRIYGKLGHAPATSVRGV